MPTTLIETPPTPACANDDHTTAVTAPGLTDRANPAAAQTTINTAALRLLGDNGAAGSPTTAEIAAGAAALADFKDVIEIRLFGSTARGAAHEDSDLDYLVICTDLDYAKRNELALSMQRAAGTASDRDVDVRLTDLCEWTALLKISSSFESGIAPDAITLLRRDPGTDVPFDKEIEIATPGEHAIEGLKLMSDAMNGTIRASAPLSSESEAEDEGHVVEARAMQHSRWLSTLGNANQALEHGLRALGHITSGRSPGKDHQLLKLLECLGQGEIAQEAAAILDPLKTTLLPPPVAPNEDELKKPEHIFTNYRVVATYGPRTPTDKHLGTQRVTAYLHAVEQLALLLHREIHDLDLKEDEETAATLWVFNKSLEKFQQFRAGYDPSPSRPQRPPM